MKRFYLLPIVCCALSISLSAQENNGTATTSGADDNRILSADSLITTDARLDSLYQTLPDTGECVSTARSNQLPRAMAYYYIGLSLPDSDSPVGQACRYRLITTPDPHYQPQGPWQAQWRGARPAEKREFYVLLVRAAE